MSQDPTHDVFVSYHSPDGRAVKRVAQALQGKGLTVFLERWCLEPGRAWPEALEKAVNGCRAVVTFIGPHGMGGWQQREVFLALDRQKRDPTFPVIPVVLPNADPPLGTFLSLNTWVDLRNCSPDDPVEMERLVAAVRGEPAGPEAKARVARLLSGICPYRGLYAFREEDEPLFFGKEEFSENLREMVERYRIVAVVGASGAGKSSVVNAGLLPRLRQSRSPVWEFTTFVPTDRPIRSLAKNLVPMLQPELSEVDQLTEIKKLATGLQGGDILLRDVADQILTRQTGTDCLLLVVDQWEELYTLCDDHSARQHFVDLLLEATEKSKLHLVLTIRGDFYHRLLEHRLLMDRLRDGNQRAIVDLPAMNRDELRRAADEPARRVAIQFEPGLLNRILDAALDEPGSLPLLEFGLQELWTRRSGPELKHDTYNAMGGIEGAMARRAETEFERLEPGQREIARRVFVQLVRPGEGTGDTRRRATFAELGDDARPVVQALANSRLIVTNRDRDGDSETVEVAHEALIRHWDRLRGWMEEVREFRAWQEQLRASIRQWMISGRAEDALPRGVLLEEAERRLHDPPCDVSQSEREFIQAAVELRARQIAEAQAIEQDARAKSLVDSLGKADIAQVPSIVQELEGCGQRADAILAEQLAIFPRGRPERRNYALARLPHEPALLDELTDELLQCDPHAFPVIRQMLAPCKQRIIDRLWNICQGNDRAEEPARLRAAAALALYDPDDRPWEEAAGGIAQLLTSITPALLSPWQNALQPVKKHLIIPLARIFRDREVDELQRSVACSILADYASDQPSVLTDLICDADPRQCAVLFPKITEHEQEALGLLEMEVAQPLQRAQADSEALAVARRKAAAGMTLLRLGERTRLLDVLRVRDDPESLTQFVHRCRAWGVTPDELRECVAVADNRRQTLQGEARQLEDRVLYGLLLALGEYPPRAFAEKHQEPLVRQLGDWYRHDPSSAIHGASGWLLRHWQQQDLSEIVDRTAIPYDPRREWFTREISVTGPGGSRHSFFLTFVVFYPGEYWIGSPDGEADGNIGEFRHRVRVTRPFAVLDRPITRAEVEASGYRPNIDQWVPSRQGPMVATNWYDAVRFCRWLTLQAGMSEREQPYADPKILTSGGLVRKARYPPDPSPDAEGAPLIWPLRLDRSGFRLPTEAEWEIACRGGMLTAYAFGRNASHLGHYAWFLENSGRQTHVPREKRPNLRGLFDMSGNVWEWCHDWHGGYDVDIVKDPVGPPVGLFRVLRGGCWYFDAECCRSTFRFTLVPTSRANVLGFRLALSLSGAPGPAEPGVEKED